MVDGMDWLGVLSSVWVIGLVTTVAAFGFVRRAAPQRASWLGRLGAWLVLTYLLFTAVWTTVTVLARFVGPVLSGGTVPFIRIAIGTSPIGTLPWWLDGVVKVGGGLVLAIGLARRVDWPGLATWSGWTVPIRWRWVPILAAAALLFWPFAAASALIGLVLVMPGVVASPNPGLLLALNGLGDLWVVAYLLAIPPAIHLARHSQATVAGGADALASTVPVIRPGSRRLLTLLITGVLGAGLAEVLQRLAAALRPLLGLMDAGWVSGPERGWSLALALAPLLVVPLLNWRSIENRAGVAFSRWVRLLLVLSVGVWVTWPVTYMGYAAAMGRQLSLDWQAGLAGVDWAKLAVFGVAVLGTLYLLVWYRPKESDE
jgi:hypothetical protein